LEGLEVTGSGQTLPARSQRNDPLATQHGKNWRNKKGREKKIIKSRKSDWMEEISKTQ